MSDACQHVNSRMHGCMSGWGHHEGGLASYMSKLERVQHGANDVGRQTGRQGGQAGRVKKSVLAAYVSHESGLWLTETQS